MIITRITINLLFKELYLFHFEKNGITKHILLTFETKTLRFITADICGAWGVEVGPLP